jgi:hypothetical protein
MWGNLPVLATAILAILPSVTSAAGFPASYKGPKSVNEFRKHHPYHHPVDSRRKVYIRSSKNDTDDISADFYAGLKKANHGGTLVLPKGKTFVIGKKLDLTFLNNVQVQLDGEILVCHLNFDWNFEADVVVYRQYHLLAKQLFLSPFSEVNHFLEMGRQGHQDLRRRSPQRKWAVVVGRVRGWRSACKFSKGRQD